MFTSTPIGVEGHSPLNIESVFFSYSLGKWYLGHLWVRSFQEISLSTEWKGSFPVGSKGDKKSSNKDFTSQWNRHPCRQEAGWRQTGSRWILQLHFPYPISASQYIELSSAICVFILILSALLFCQFLNLFTLALFSVCLLWQQILELPWVLSEYGHYQIIMSTQMRNCKGPRHQ